MCLDGSARLVWGEVMHKGSCLCGAIQYRIDGALSEFGYCHCQSCRKASGSAFGANVGVDRKDLQLSDPNAYLKEYESSTGKLRAFCSNCGSPVYAYLESNSGVVRIRLGTLDTRLDKTAKAHTFVRDKADWDVIEDSLPQFDGWADKDVLVQLGARQV